MKPWVQKLKKKNFLLNEMKKWKWAWWEVEVTDEPSQGIHVHQTNNHAQ